MAKKPRNKRTQRNARLESSTSDSKSRSASPGVALSYNLSSCAPELTVSGARPHELLGACLVRESDIIKSSPGGNPRTDRMLSRTSPGPKEAGAPKESPQAGAPQESPVKSAFDDEFSFDDTPETAKRLTALLLTTPRSEDPAGDFECTCPSADVCKSQVLLTLIRCKRWLEWSKQRRLQEQQTTQTLRSKRLFRR